MRLLVEKIYMSAEDIIVDFSCEFGKAEAYWNTKPIPRENAEYEVELDITDELLWGQNVKLSKDNKFSIIMHKDEIYITGILEKQYKNGLADFRLGKNLIQLELEGKNVPTGRYVTINTASLDVYQKNS